MVIYKILNKINGKIYIGQTRSKPSRRWASHKQKLRRGIHSNSHLQSAWDKYTEDNFEFDIIESNVNTYEELNRLEIYWIQFYDSTNREKGYNLEAGGSRNKIVSEETRLKMSKNANTELNKARLRGLRKGVKLTNEHREALLKSITGKVPSKETRDKIAKSNTGKKHSEETKAKMSELKKGKTGRIMSEETKKKISESNKGRIFSEQHKRNLIEAKRKRSAKIKQTIE